MFAPHVVGARRFIGCLSRGEHMPCFFLHLFFFSFFLLLQHFVQNGIGRSGFILEGKRGGGGGR